MSIYCMPQHVKCSFKTNNRILLSRYAGKANDCGKKEKQKRFVVESSLYFVCNTVFEVNIIACNRNVLQWLVCNPYRISGKCKNCIIYNVVLVSLC